MQAFYRRKRGKIAMKRWVRTVQHSYAAFAFAILLTVQPAFGATYTVTNTNDSGARSLRNANASAFLYKLQSPGASFRARYVHFVKNTSIPWWKKRCQSG
jgi:hypothetical protein